MLCRLFVALSFHPSHFYRDLVTGVVDQPRQPETIRSVMPVLRGCGNANPNGVGGATPGRSFGSYTIHQFASIGTPLARLGYPLVTQSFAPGG
jgi:hypothetical protein